MNNHKKQSPGRLAIGAAAFCLLLLACSAKAQPPDDGQGAGLPEPLGEQIQGTMPAAGGAPQQLQADAPSGKTQGKAKPAAPPSAGQQGSQLPLPGNPAALQQNLRFQMQSVLGLNAAAQQPAALPGGMQIDSAISSAAAKIDPKVQAAINEKMLKIMEETIRETLSGTGMQEMRKRMMAERLQGNFLPTPGGGLPQQPAPGKP